MASLRSTPLHDLHATQGARFAPFAGWDVALDFGDPRREYDALVGGAAVLDLSWMAKLSVTGRDRVRYLHNMLSNDIKSLAVGRGCYAAMLTHQGRMEADPHVYALADELRLECLPAGAGRLLESLRRFVVADQVVFEDQTEHFALLSVQGAEARPSVEEATGVRVGELGPLGHAAVPGRERWSVVRRDRAGREGYDLWLPAEDAPAVWRAWTAQRGATATGLTALDWARTEAGMPWYGVDMDETSLPMEFGLMHAISMTKGCYRGQEIVARVVHRGLLHRGLAGVGFEGGEVPARGAVLRAGASAAGEITSATYSPRLGRWLALAVVKEPHRVPGARLELEGATPARTGVVVPLPLA